METSPTSAAGDRARTVALLLGAALLMLLARAAFERFDVSHNTGFYKNDVVLRHTATGPMRETFVSPEEILECMIYLFVVLPGAVIAAAAMAPWLGRRLTAGEVRVPAFGPTASLLVALVGVGSFLVASQVLEFTPITIDEFVSGVQSRILARGKLWLPRPEFPELTANWFILQTQDKYCGQYLPGWPAMLAPGALAGNPHLIPPLCAALALAACLAAWRVAASPGICLLAGAHLALSPLFVLNGATLLNAVPDLMLLAGFIAAALRAAEGRGRRWGLMAGAALGWSLLTRPLTAVAWGGAAAAYFLCTGGRPAVRRLAWVLPPLLFAAATMLAYDWAVTGDPFTTPYERFNPREHLGFGPRGMEGLEHGPGRAALNLAITGTRLTQWLFGWPLSFVFIPFAFLGRQEPGGRRGLWGSVVAAHTAAYLLYYSPGVGLTGGYYHAELLLPLAVLSASGLAWLHRVAMERRELFLRGLPAAVLLTQAAAGLLLFWPSKLEQMAMLAEFTRAPLRPVEEARLGEAIVFLTPREVPPAQGIALNTPVVHPALAPVGGILYLNNPAEPAVRRKFLEVEGRDRPAYLFDWERVTPLLPGR